MADRKKASRPADRGTITVDGHELVITNPDKPLWPEMGITKLIYLQKLIALSPHLIRHCRNRYLTVIRWPHGIHGDFFYQKNAPEPRPPFVGTAVSGGIRYVHLDNLATLLWLANLGALEFHASFERIGSPEPPEWVIDLDPSREEDPRIMEAAAIVGDVLASLGIASVPKTSGATGVQIIVPLAPGHAFEQLRALGRFIGRFVCEKHPRLFTLERLKKDRGDRIYFDYLQHWPGKTLAAPYTPRARVFAPVSAPLTWDEVHAGVRPQDFHLLNMERRLAETGDLLEQTPPQRLDDVLAFIGAKTKTGSGAGRRSGPPGR
jgi:bifunctional non-homologous end joining protein LigD